MRAEAWPRRAHDAATAATIRRETAIRAKRNAAIDIGESTGGPVKRYLN